MSGWLRKAYYHLACYAVMLHVVVRLPDLVQRVDAGGANFSLPAAILSR